MKYLNDYMQVKQTELFNQTGAFFAFNHKQFIEAREEGVKYIDLGHGMICPKKNVDILTSGLEEIYNNSIKQDLEENGNIKIIKRELSNHECYYTYDITDVIDKLKDYQITPDEIRKIFNSQKHKATL